MLLTPTRLIPGSALGTSTTALYTVAGTGVLSAIAKSIRLTNTSATPVTVNGVWIVPGGGSAAAANSIIPQTVLQAYETQFWAMAEVLPLGYTIQASALTANVVGITVSGAVAT